MQMGPMRFGHRVTVTDWDMERDPSFIDHLIASTKRDLAGEIAEHMGDRQYNIKFELHCPPKVDFADYTVRKTVVATVIPTEVREIVTRSYTPSLTAIDPGPPKHFCPYCHGHTFDDSRGNCAACGGPRYA